MKPWERFAQAPQEQTGPWTKFSAPREELPRLAPNTDRKYSDLEKAKYTLRAAGEGAALGTGDIVAGASNVLMNDLAQVTHGQNLKERAKGAWNLLRHANPLDLAGQWDLYRSEGFKKGRKDFVQEQEEFAKAHPGLNTVGELAGGLATAAFGGAASAAKSVAGKGLLRTMGQGAKEGAKWGGIFGAGNGLTADAERLSPGGALQGGISGAVLGAPLGGAFGLAGAAMGKAAKTGKKWIANYKNKDYNTLAKAAGEEEINRSIMQREALLDNAGEELMRQAERAKLKKPEAAQILRDYGEERLGQQRSTLEHAIDDQFGNLGYSQRLEKMDIARKAEDGPLYQRAILGEDGEGVLLDKMRLTRDEMDYVEKVYKTTGMKNATRGLPYNHMRVLDYAKQLMDSDISRAVRNEDGTKVANLEALKNGFLTKIDAQNPVYKRARSVFERYERLKDAMSKGKRINSGSISERRFDLDGMSEKEKQYYTYGAREKLLENFNNFKSGKGNLTKKVFDQNTLQRLKLLPLKDRAALEKTVARESRAAENINRLLGGSQTAEREQSMGKLATNPRGSAVNWLSDKIDQILMQADPQEVAKMLTDPGYLAAKRWQAMQRDIDVARRVGKVHFNLLRAGGPLLRQDEPAARVSGKSWWKIKASPDWRTYQSIKEIPDVYSTGKYSGPTPNNKQRDDGMKQWHWFEKEKNGLKLGLQVGEDEKGRVVYNINAKEAAGDPGYRPGAATSTYSIGNKNSKIKPFSMRDFMRVLLSPQFGGIAGEIGKDIYKKNSQGLPRSQSVFNGNSFKAVSRSTAANNISQKTPRVKPLSFRDILALYFSPQTQGAAGGVLGAQYAKKPIKPFNMRDFMILLGRPLTLGLEGNMAREEK